MSAVVPPSARETYTRERKSVSIQFRGGKAAAAATTEARGEAVRVIASGRMGSAVRSGPSSKAESELLVARAVAAAEAGDAPAFLFPASAEPPVAPRTFEAATETLGPADLQALGRSAIERIRERVPEASVDLDLSAEVTRSTLDNSSGVGIEERATSFFASATASLALDGDLVNVAAQAGARGPAGVLDAVVARTVEALAHAQKKGQPVPAGSRVLFAPEAMAGLLDPFVLGLDGSEAALGGSPLAYALGRELFDRRLSLVDDGLHPSGPASSRWDGEGTPRRALALVERGVLAGFYHDLRSAAQSSTESTGNAVRRGLLPTRSPGNWIFSVAEPWALRDLLREAGTALLVMDLLGVGQGSSRDGAFSYPVGLAFAVRDGEIQGRVSDLVVSGNLYDVLRDGLVAAGDDAAWTYTLGVPVLTPTLLLETVAIAG